MVHFIDAVSMLPAISVLGKTSHPNNEILTVSLQAFCWQEHMQSLITNDWW